MALLLIAVLHFGLYIAFAIKVMCLKRHLTLSLKLEVRFDKHFSETIHLLLRFPQTEIEDMRLFHDVSLKILLWPITCQDWHA